MNIMLNMCDASYYVLVNGERKGPFSLEKLAEMLDKHEIALETDYSQSDISEWLPLSQNKFLLEQFAQELLPKPGEQWCKMNVDDDTGAATLEITGPMAELFAQPLCDVLDEEGFEASVVNMVTGENLVPSPRHEDAPPEIDVLSVTDKALSEAGIKIENGWLKIETPHFYGQCHRSSNGRFILAWRDISYAGNRNWIGENGKYVLLDGATIILRGIMHRPEYGLVANNGRFILNDTNDYLDGAEHHAIKGTFYVFSPTGDIIIEEKFGSYLDNGGISEDGSFAVRWGIIVPNPDTQTNADIEALKHPSPSAGNKHDDYEGDKLCLYDLEQRKILGRFALVFGSGSGGDSGRWVERDYDIDSEAYLIRVVYQNGVVHQYGFDGSFHDAESWKTKQVDIASGYELLNIAKTRLRTRRGSDLVSYLDVINLLERALAKGVSEYTQAIIHRHLGEIYDSHEEAVKALKHLEAALHLYPRIGVKDRVARLKAACQENQ